jgi:integrase/recombinase XerD
MATYQSIISYINSLRSSQKRASIHRILQSIKKYYNYLNYTEQRIDNPARNINLKDSKSKGSIVQNRLLSTEELAKLWQHFNTKKYRYGILKNRTIAMVSLLLYQGLRSGEIGRLMVENIDLEKAQIYIEKSRGTRARTLALQSAQIFPFYQYMYQDRPRLLGDKTSNALFINKLGRAESGESLHYLIETTRSLLPHKIINPKVIRMSVLSEQFKQGKSLQEVQYFAGHRYPSSTERYKTSDLKALQENILKHHPLG